MTTLQELIEIQTTADQMSEHKARQRQARRLCGAAIKMLNDAYALFAQMDTDARPGGALELAADLHTGWMALPMPLPGGDVTMAKMIDELRTKSNDLHAYMAAVQAIHEASGFGQFFIDLPPYEG